MTTSNDVTLGYWAIRGLTGAIRHELAYCGISFQEKLYTDGNEWFSKDKPGLGVDFPNLPYLKIGSKAITQSHSILTAIPIISGKRDLLGDDDEKFTQVQTALFATIDLFNKVDKLCWTKGNFETEKEEFFKGTGKTLLTHYDTLLKNRDWLCGFISVADFKFFESVELIHDIDEKLLEPYPNLVAYYKRFIEIPQIKEFRQTPLFKKLWFFPKSAAWNNE